MAGEWQSASLGEICELRAGAVFPPALQGKSVGKYPFVKVSDMNLSGNEVSIQNANNWVDDDDLSKIKASPFPPGTTVFAKIGEALKANRLRFLIRPTLIDNNMMGAMPIRDGIDPRFFFYALSQFDFGEIAGGTALPYLTVGTLSQLEVLLPPLSEQRAIAHILGTLDDKIELNRRMSATLEETARAIFKSWFVDFDPVRAKAAVRREHPTWTDEQVNRTACPNLKPEIAALFPDSFEDSELGEIPKGWRVGPMSEIASLQTRTIQPNKQPDVRWEHYSIPAYDEGQQPKQEMGAAIKSGKYAVPPASVLVSKLNPQFPRIWLPWVTDSAFAICSTEFMPFLPKHANWRPFIYEMLKSQSLREAVKAHVTGPTGSRQRAKPSEIAELSVFVPPTDTITAFSQLVDPLHVRLMQNRRQNSTLAALRDALLPKLISGEIRIKDAERFLKERGL